MNKLITVIALAMIVIFSACADSKAFKKKDGTTFVAEPYGWGNKNTKRIDGVIYEVCVPCAGSNPAPSTHYY